MWPVTNILNYLIWCISGIMKLGGCFWDWVCMVYQRVRFFLLRRIYTSRLRYYKRRNVSARDIIEKKKALQRERDWELEGINKVIQVAKREISHYEEKVKNFKKDRSGLKSIIKDTPVVQVTGYSVINDYLSIQVYTKDTESVLVYMILTPKPKDFEYIYHPPLLPYDIRFIDSTYQFEFGENVSCKDVYFIVTTVMKSMKVIRDSSTIKLLCGVKTIANNDSIFSEVVHNHSLTMNVIFSSKKSSVMTMEYTAKTIDSFLSQKWNPGNNRIVLHLS